MNGMDMLIGSALRLTGVDPDAIKAFATKLMEDGALDKVTHFINRIDETNALLRKISNDYDNVCARCGGDVVAGSSHEPVTDPLMPELSLIAGPATDGSD